MTIESQITATSPATTVTSPATTATSPTTTATSPTTSTSTSTSTFSPTTTTATSPTTSTFSPTTSGKKLTLIPLIFLIYFEVAGGPYGEEPAVQAAGPLFAILGFLIFPFIWCIPEALITSELSTAFPGNGGFVTWAAAAFGPFAASLIGSWKYLTVVINIAAFPILCIDYLVKLFPVLKDGVARNLAVVLSTLALSFLNYTGLTIVGYTAVLLGIVSLMPFVLMSLIAIPQIRPHRWLSLGQKGVKKDWNLYFNTLFWNLNYWDSVSTLAGEVDKPQKTFPLALFIAVIFTCVSYLIPLMAVTGSVQVDQSEWTNGFMANAAQMISGQWLKIWIEIGAVLSAIGMIEAQLSSSTYQLMGMAELGILPKFFGLRSKWFHTPWVAILVSTAIIIGMTYMNFSDIVASANFLYSLGMLLEFASFIWLRRKFPTMKRPYKVPLNIPVLVVVCLVPSAFLIVIMVIATKIVYLVSGLMTVGAIAWYFLMKLCKKKKWLEFSDSNGIGLMEEEEEERL